MITNAFRNYNNDELIVQVIRTYKDIKYESDLSADERYFLNDAVSYKKYSLILFRVHYCSCFTPFHSTKSLTPIIISCFHHIFKGALFS